MQRLFKVINTDSTLTASNTTNNWLITGENDGQLNGLVFIDFNNLVGGTEVDNFVFESLGSVTGVIDGGAGVGVIDSVDLTAIENDIVVAVDDSTQADLNILGIEQLDANSNFNNQLVGSDTNNIWNIEDTNAGTLNLPTQSIAFSGFANLLGGSGDDTFNLNNADHITGLIDGGGGANDVLNMLSLNRDITVRLGPVAGASANDTLYVNGVEQINANSTRDNTIVGQDIASSWTIDSVNSSRVESMLSPTDETSVNFSGFNRIVGGLNDDTFAIINATNLTQIVGGDGSGNDSIDYSGTLDDINITIGGGLAPGSVNIVGIEGLIGNNDGTGTFNSQITVVDGDNIWTLSDFDGAGIADGINDGVFQDQDGNVITFINFNILQGGSGVDQFIVNNGASITGFVHGGGGDDQLNLSFNQAGTFTFIGGEGTDSVFLTGGADSYDAYYSSNVNGYEQLEYTDPDNGTYNVRFAGVESVNDDVVATDFTILGSSGTDTISIGTGAVSVNGNTVINYTNRTNLILAAGVDDTFDLVDDLNLGSGNLTITNSNLTNSSGSTIQAASFVVNAAGTIGSIDQRVNTNIDTLTIDSNTNDVFLNEVNDVEIAALNTSGEFNLVAGGDITQSVDSVLNSTGIVVLNSGRNIILQNQNQLLGLTSLIAANDVLFSNANDTEFGDVSAVNLTLDINGNISDSGAMTITGQTQINANGNEVILDSATNDFNSISVDSASNLLLVDQGQLTLGNINVSERVEVNADDILVSEDFNANEIILSANGLLDLNANLTTNVGDLTLSAANVAQNGNLVSASNIVVTASQGITMEASTSSITSTGNITYTAGNNIALATLNAEQGTVRVESTSGELLDNNEDADNIVANRAELISQNGIGTQDGLETQIAVLFAENTQGTIRLNNRGNILLERLATVGDIEFNNADMDGADITFMPGSVDAGYDVGAVFMTTEGGSFLGDGTIPDFDNADIVAREASFVDSLLQGTFGTLARPLVLRVRDSVLIAVSAIYNPLYAEPLPEINTSDSLFNFNAFDTIAAIIGGQLVLVEELEDVDPAIFTDIRNYNHDDVAVKLPRDQLYDDDTEEEFISAGIR